jgi:glycosyltransferase involved in cell wall biosynthesis
MRIRYVVVSAYGSGGTTRTVLNQANALCADHDVEIASLYRHRPSPRLPIDPRVRLVALTELGLDGRPRPDRSVARLASAVLRLPNPWPHRHDHLFRRWRPVVDARLTRYFRREDDGVLVTTRPGLNLLAARLAPRRLIRVAQDHRNLSSYPPALRRSIVRAYRRLDALVVLTERDQDEYRRAFGGFAPRLERIPNGVPAARLAAADLDAKVIVAAGRLQPSKGFDLLLDAFGSVAAAYPDWQLWIFGDGSQRADLAAQIDRLGLSGRAVLQGFVYPLDEHLVAASMFVLSSRYEGLPMAMLEAMSLGLPVVAFDCPTGPAEVITHGRSGLLVPPGDVAGLAAAIGALIEDPARRRALGAQGRAESRRYAMDTVARRWDALFTELAGARSPFGER